MNGGTLKSLFGSILDPAWVSFRVTADSVSHISFIHNGLGLDRGKWAFSRALGLIDYAQGVRYHCSKSAVGQPFAKRAERTGCVDTLSPEARSERMGRIRSKHTKPEMLVRRLVHGLGYRYRLHKRDLPGSPDLIFKSRKKVVFVHGCFWHGHACKLGRMPKSKIDFWSKKKDSNRARDARVLGELEALGWQALVLWECELKDMGKLEQSIRSFLDA
jgi:DNA mismatch endonuclease (patch repair protein)